MSWIHRWFRNNLIPQLTHAPSLCIFYSMSEEHSEGASFVDEDPIEYASRKAIEHREGAWAAIEVAAMALLSARFRKNADLIDATAAARTAQIRLSEALDNAAQATAYQGFVDAGR